MSWPLYISQVRYICNRLTRGRSGAPMLPGGHTMSSPMTPEARTPGAKRAGPGEYVFDLHRINQILGGPGYSPVFGGCVEGERMIVALMRYPAGKPSDAHSHPNEQW